MAITTTAAINAAIARARQMPAQLGQIELLDPQLAATVEAKPLAYSRSPWGTLAAGAIGLVSARYGLGLDDHTTELVAGVAVLAGSFAMRAITSRPIAGVLRVPAAPVPAAAPAA